MSAAPDFTFSQHGSLCLLKPLTPAAVEWVEEHIPEDAQAWAGSVVIEPRYAEAILRGIASDGLQVAL